MKKDDVDRLFELLEIYFPGYDRLKDKVLKNAWLLVLKPFEPDDVKQAVASYLRERKQFPFVQEIAVRCHGPSTAADTDAYVCEQEKLHLASVRAYQSVIGEALKERGLPPMPSRGLVEWNRMVEAAGIDIAAIIGDTWRAVNETQGRAADGTCSGTGQR